MATGEFGKNTRYWCGVGFLPCNYVPVTCESSSKQLGHADMLEWVKKANYFVKLSGKLGLQFPQVLIFTIGVYIS